MYTARKQVEETVPATQINQPGLLFTNTNEQPLSFQGNKQRKSE